MPSPICLKWGYCQLAINKESGDVFATDFDRPLPVRIPPLGLFVKYGADVTVTEAATQVMVRERLCGQVPIPEVFGSTEDENQRFIYMELLEGKTLLERWCDMSEDERLTVCHELQTMVKAWRALTPDQHDYYVEAILEHRPTLVGPFLGENAVQQFQDTCGIVIAREEPITFTHNDLVPLNIVLTPGPSPKIAAIIDWAQAGWYLAYWEYCKARRVRVHSDNPRFDDAVQEEWWAKYLPMILNPVDDQAYYHPWLWFVLSKGF
ncbi:phosphotransferase family protein [Penicillium alfredii]|uniref:Phosphotransferase family protein n=1 Tax=Penicillium alfredii TaxID=1506179 RepID=A0A9W9FSR1_9EURO|nr:phosphotransferase family protein [Penicillium alfredii]KAJ5105683.1 phosphotransferase family protein [Penicillium alfredii]